MHMIGHNHSSVKLVAFPVIMQAVPEHNIPGLRREWVTIAFAECDENGPSCLLVMRHLAPVIVHPFERRARRPLQFAAVVFGFHGLIATETLGPCL